MGTLVDEKDDPRLPDSGTSPNTGPAHAGPDHASPDHASEDMHLNLKTAAQHKDGALRRSSPWLGALLTAMAATACGADDQSSGPDADTCVPGRSVACTTDDGCEGAQECNGGGTYDPCECGAEPSPGRGGGGNAGDGGAGAGGHASGGVDPGGTGGTGGTGNAGNGTGNAGNGTGGTTNRDCAPADMSAWTPPDYVPARQTPGACTTAQLQRFHDDCLMGSDCSAFESGGDDEDCGACMWPSALDASRWGPVLEVNPRPFYRWENNTAGCHELLRAANRDCAEQIQVAQNCAREACLDVCDVTGAAYSACVVEARTAVCEDYTATATCITSADDLAACSGDTFEQIVLAQGEVFCG